MMLHGKYAALDYKTQLPFCFSFSTYCTIHYYTQKGAVFPQLLIVSFFLFYGSCCNSSLVLLSVTDYTAFPLFPTLHSGKSPGRSALIQERNRLRRRSVIRVGNNNTGL